jgi:hypothetical protein
VKIVSSAILASACAVALLLLVSLALDSGAEWARIEVPKVQVIARPQEVKPSAASVTTSHEAAVARMKHCNIDAVIYHTLQSGGGGAGPICVID